MQWVDIQAQDGTTMPGPMPWLVEVMTDCFDTVERETVVSGV